MKITHIVGNLSRIAVICTVFATIASVQMAEAETTPLSILRRSINARTTVSFTGLRTVVVFENGQRVREVRQRVYSQAPDRMRVEFLTPESERGRLHVSVGSIRWDYHPNTNRAVRIEAPPVREKIRNRLDELDRIAQTMTLQHAGRDTIAGRPTHVIKIYTAEGVTVQKSWIDGVHFVSLKTQRFDGQENLRSSTEYTEISYEPAFAPGTFDFEPPRGCTVVESSRPAEPISLAEAERKVGFSAVLPEYLPRGYSLQRDRANVIEVQGQKTLWLPFSNTMETLSLFQRRARSTGDVHQGSRSITWTDGGFCFTLMGPLSRTEMRRIKQSIEP